MEKVIGDWDTIVKLTVEEARDICRIGQGTACCAFLVLGPTFECIRMDSSNSIIFQRIAEGSMTAKGEGGWEGCAWEQDLKCEQYQNIEEGTE